MSDKPDDLDSSLEKIRTHLKPDDQNQLDDLKELLDQPNPSQAQLRAAVYKMGCLATGFTCNTFMQILESLKSVTSRGARQVTGETTALLKNKDLERAKSDAMQKAVNEAHERNPDASYTKLCKIVATKFRRSARTISRRTVGPSKK